MDYQIDYKLPTGKVQAHTSSLKTLMHSCTNAFIIEVTSNGRYVAHLFHDGWLNKEIDLPWNANTTENGITFDVSGKTPHAVLRKVRLLRAGHLPKTTVQINLT